MDISDSNIGCGVYQLFNLRDGAGSLRAALETINEHEYHHLRSGVTLLFSDVVQYDQAEKEDAEYNCRPLEYNGKTLAALITKHKLGKLRMLPKFKNPNSGNIVRIWSWVIDEKTIRAADLISTTPADKWT